MGIVLSRSLGTTLTRSYIEVAIVGSFDAHLVCGILPSKTVAFRVDAYSYGIVVFDFAGAYQIVNVWVSGVDGFFFKLFNYRLRDLLLNTNLLLVRKAHRHATQDKYSCCLIILAVLG